MASYHMRNMMLARLLPFGRRWFGSMIFSPKQYISAMLYFIARRLGSGALYCRWTSAHARSKKSHIVRNRRRADDSSQRYLGHRRAYQKCRFGTIAAIVAFRSAFIKMRDWPSRSVPRQAWPRIIIADVSEAGGIPCAQDASFRI